MTFAMASGFTPNSHNPMTIPRVSPSSPVCNKWLNSEMVRKECSAISETSPKRLESDEADDEAAEAVGPTRSVVRARGVFEEDAESPEVASSLPLRSRLFCADDDDDDDVVDVDVDYDGW